MSKNWIRINIIYFLRFLNSYLFREIENFLKSSSKFFVFLHKKDSERLKTKNNNEFEKKENLKINEIKNIIKKLGKKDLKKLKENSKIRDKTVSNFRNKNKKIISDFTKNVLGMNNSCEKRATKKISFTCRNTNQKVFKNKFNISKLKKIVKIKNTVLKSNLEISNNFEKYENFIIKIKKAIDLLKNKRYKKITDFEYHQKFLQEKLDHFEEDNNFLKGQLSKKDENIKYFKNEFSKFHKLILKGNHSEFLNKKKKNIKLVPIINQKKYFSKLVQTKFDKGNNFVFNTKEKNCILNIKECFDKILQYGNNNKLNNYDIDNKNNIFENRKSIKKKSIFAKNYNISFYDVKKCLKKKYEIGNNFNILFKEKKNDIINLNQIEENYNIKYFVKSISTKKNFYIQNLFYLFLQKKINSDNIIKKNYITTYKKKINFLQKEKNFIYLQKKIIRKINLTKNFEFTNNLINDNILYEINKSNKFFYKKNITSKKISDNYNLMVSFKNYENDENKNNYKKNIYEMKKDKNYSILFHKKITNNFDIINFGTILLKKNNKSLLKNQNQKTFFKSSEKLEKKTLETKKFVIFINLLKKKNKVLNFNFNLFKNNKTIKEELKTINFGIYLKKSLNKKNSDLKKYNIFKNIKKNKELSLKIYNYFTKQKILKKNNLKIKQSLNYLQKRTIIEIDNKNTLEENNKKELSLKNYNYFTKQKILKKNHYQIKQSLNYLQKRTTIKIDTKNTLEENNKITKKSDFIKKYSKTKNKLNQLVCVYRLNDKKQNKIILDLTTKLNNKKDNPGKLQMMKELIKKMEIEMDFLTKKLDKINEKINPEDYNYELENKNKKLCLVIKNLQEKLKKSNKKKNKITKKIFYYEENISVTNKFLEYILMNFFRFDYKKIEKLHSYDTLTCYQENLEVVLSLLEKCFLDLNKEKSKFKNLDTEIIEDNIKINFVIIDYLKKTLKMKNQIENLNKEKINFNKIISTVTDFGFEKEQIKSSFVKFFYFIRVKKFKELQIVSKVILDLLDLDNDEKNEILEILLNLL